MKRKYILINSEALLVPTWVKIIIYIALTVLFANIMGFVDRAISSSFGIEQFKVLRVTCFIRAFIYLALTYDLVPRFKKTIGIASTIIDTFVYINLLRDKLFIIPFILMIFMIILNIIFAKKYRKVKNKNS